MKNADLKSIKVIINNYLESSTPYPFFISVNNDEDYKGVLELLSQYARVRLSDYCIKDDSYPDIGGLISDVLASDKVSYVLGIGEYSLLMGSRDTIHKISATVLKSKLIVPCRYCETFLKEECSIYKKFEDTRVCFFNGSESPVVTIANRSILSAGVFAKGFKDLLSKLELSSTSKMHYFVCTEKQIPRASMLETYDILKLNNAPLIPKDYLTKDQWEDYLENTSLNDYPINHWRSFFKFKISPPSNAYLKLVVSLSNNSDEYCEKLVDAIMDISPDDAQFEQYYSLRKDIISSLKLPLSRIVKFIHNALMKTSSVEYLTDLTDVEKQAIIFWICTNNCVPVYLERVYPDLFYYLEKYVFDKKTNHDDLFTKYFDEYKRSKVLDNPSEYLLNMVDELAYSSSRPINFIDYRQKIMQSISKADTYLLWIDALGVEYLSYIQYLASKRNLILKIHIGRSDLPSSTEFNKEFYDMWEANSRRKCTDFDKVIHSEFDNELGYDKKSPIYLSKQLDILNSEFDRISAILEAKTYRKVLLVSDHGSSRFALKHEGNTIVMKGHGKDGGRCCPVSSEDRPLPNIIKDNDYWSCANYDRFKFGEKVGVELHGGATLEEVLIPIIEIEKLNSMPIFEVETKEIPVIPGKSFKLKFNCDYDLHGVSLKIDGKLYAAISKGKEHIVEISGIKRSGKIYADVYENDSKIGHIQFLVVTGLKENDLFDF